MLPAVAGSSDLLWTAGWPAGYLINLGHPGQLSVGRSLVFPLVLAFSLPPWRTPHPFCLGAFARAAPPSACAHRATYTVLLCCLGCPGPGLLAHLKAEVGTPAWELSLRIWPEWVSHHLRGWGN